jgi:methylated-DNA-[protein]-cysteine S-methyltransferase
MDDTAPPGGSTGVYACESASLDAWVQLGTAGGKVISLSFPEDPADDFETDHPLLDRIERYLDGVDPVTFEDVDVALTAGGDRRAILQTLQNVPYGEALACGQLARMTGGLSDDDEGLRTVRETLAANPVPLLVPDHRVRDGPSGAPPRVVQRLRSIEGL